MSCDLPTAAVPPADLADSDALVVLRGLGKRYEIYRRPHHRLLQTLLRGRRTFYREFWALRDVTLTVQCGETLGLVGRNGSGKSTLLQLVAGTLHPTAGSVRVRGRVAALLELGSGFNPEFTGRENVYLNGAILGIRRREMDAAFPAIAEFADIGEFIDQPLKTYSTGMMVRLAFAVAVHSTPDLLIVDEALSVGDSAFQSKCLTRIREMQRAGTSILLVSHSPNVIIEFCTRAAYLDAGRLRAVGGCRDVLEAYYEDVVGGEGGVAMQLETEQTAAPPVAESGSEPESGSEVVGVSIHGGTGVAKNVFGWGETVCVTLDVLHHAANPAPCFGIQLRMPDDIALWATTTLLMDAKLPAAPPGARRRYTWRLKAHMGGARFVFGLGVGQVVSGEYRHHLRLHYAGHFDVLPQPRSGTGWLEPSAQFGLDENAA